MAEAVPVAQVPLPCKRPVVHDKQVVRAPDGHEAHGAVHPVVKTLAVQVLAVVLKVYPGEQAVHVAAVAFHVHERQLVTPVRPVAPALHEVHVTGVATLRA